MKFDFKSFRQRLFEMQGSLLVRDLDEYVEQLVSEMTAILENASLHDELYAIWHDDNYLVYCCGWLMFPMPYMENKYTSLLNKFETTKNLLKEHGYLL